MRPFYMKCGFGLLGLLLAAAAGAATVNLELVGGLPFTVGDGGNGPTEILDSSADGRYLLLRTRATNLVAGIEDRNGDADLLVYDRTSGQLDWITREANSSNSIRGMGSVPGAISDDGRNVVYHRSTRVVVFDRVTRVERLSPFQFPVFHAASADGRWVASNIIHDCAGTLVPTLLDTTSWSWHMAAVFSCDYWGHAGFSNLANDGAVAFETHYQLGLVPDYVYNGNSELYIYEPLTESTRLVSHAFGAHNHGSNGAFSDPLFSPDSRYLVYSNTGTNLVEGFAGNTGVRQIYIYDRTDGTNRLLSGVSASPTLGANAHSWPLKLSRDGRYLFFASLATDLFPGIIASPDLSPGIFRLDLSTSAIELVNHIVGSPNSIATGTAAVVETTVDNRYTLLHGTASPLIPGQTGSESTAFLYDHQTRQAQLLVPYPEQSTRGQEALPRGLSPDGGVVFLESSSALGPGGSTPATKNVYLLNRTGGDPVRLSASAMNGVSAGLTSISNVSLIQGNVLFHTPYPELVPEFIDTNEEVDPFLYIPSTHAHIPLLSAADDPSQAPNRGTTAQPFGDKRRFLLQTKASDILSGLADFNEGDDLFLYDRTAEERRLISHRHDQTTTAGNGASYSPFPSFDESSVIFQTDASDLTPDLDGNGASDIVAWNVVSGNNTLLTRSALQPQTSTAGSSNIRQVSNGAVFFTSTAPDVVSGFVDNNGPANSDIYLFQNGSTSLISHQHDSLLEGSASLATGTVSKDGSLIVLQSVAGDLLEGTVASGDLLLFTHATQTGARAQIRPCNSGVFPKPHWEWLTLLAVDPGGTWVHFWVYSYLCNIEKVPYLWHHPSGVPTAGQPPPAVLHGRYSFTYGPGPQCANGLLLRDLATRTAVFLACVTSTSYTEVDPSGSLVAFLTSQNHLVPHDVGGTADLFVGSIDRGGLLFSDGFELGNTSLWSSTTTP